MKAIVAALAIVVLGMSVWAANPDGSLTLTPSVLYDMVQRLEASNAKKDALQTSVLLKHNSRIMALEKRVDELERKLALHAKAIGNVAVKAAK